MGKVIRVEVSPKGEVRVSVNGVKGASCKDVTKKLEEALGDVESVKETEEFYQQGTNKVQRKNSA